MMRLMVARPEYLRSVYDQWTADLHSRGEPVPSFEQWEDYVWEQTHA